MIMTTFKSKYLYNYIINEVKRIYINTRHKLDIFLKKFMMAFEASLLKVFKKNFDNTKIDGCYFHFVKLFFGRKQKN